jgi:hypothetical protein
MNEEQFDLAEVARYAQNNANGFSLLTIAYLRDRGLSVEDWASWLGRAFAGPETNWEPGMGARRMAEEAALELVSSKGRLVGISGDDEAAQVAVEWPSAEALEAIGLPRGDIDPFWTIWEPLAASVRFDSLTTRRQGDNDSAVLPVGVADRLRGGSGAPGGAGRDAAREPGH